MSTNDHYHHAPEKTELEKVLNQGVERIEPYSNLILLGILAITILGVGGIIWVRSDRAAETAAWNEFYSIQAPDDFAALANKYPDSSVGQWARLQAGRLFIAEGLRQALTNREASDERLKRAQEAFEQLLKAQVPAKIREEALYGAATCLEALSDGDNQPAIAAYEQLIQEFQDSRHRAWAEERIQALKTNTAKDFYAWFRQQNPKPEDRPQPRDFGTTPGTPDLTLPEFDLPLGRDGAASTTPPAGPAAPAMPQEDQKSLATPEAATPAPAPAPTEQPAAPTAEPKTPATPEAAAETKPEEPASPAPAVTPEAATP